MMLQPTIKTFGIFLCTFFATSVLALPSTPAVLKTRSIPVIEVRSRLDLQKRSTITACGLSSGSPQFNDAIAAINDLANLAPGTQCGVDDGCVQFLSSGSAHIGMCGPFSFGLPCSTFVAYLNGIANTCHSGSQTEGGQSLNENGDFEVWIIGG